MEIKEFVDRSADDDMYLILVAVLNLVPVTNRAICTPAALPSVKFVSKEERKPLRFFSFYFIERT